MRKSDLNQYIQLSLLMIVFFLPIMAAIYLYVHPKYWRSLSTTNYGQWAPQLTWHSQDKKARSWQWVYWHEKTCSTDCLAQLDQLGRISLAMGRKVYDLDIILLQAKGSSVSEALKQQLNTWNMTQQSISAEQVAIWNQHFSQNPIVLFDPKHQALLMYPLNPEPQKAYHDLQVLIK